MLFIVQRGEKTEAACLALCLQPSLKDETMLDFTICCEDTHRIKDIFERWQEVSSVQPLSPSICKTTGKLWLFTK